MSDAKTQEAARGGPADQEEATKFEAPHPGSPQMPRWDTGELPAPPRFTARNWFAMLGPGLVMGAAAIGGGEWLVGPLVTAKYGGALMWLATLSILAQGIYNIEISRYTLYCGEPIFTGKFRTLPGPMFWLGVYLLLDFGTFFPYLAANAATPIVVVLNGGQLPDPANVPRHWWMMKVTSSAIFLLSMVPLIFGGKIYNSLKLVMSFKLVVVIGFLLWLAVFYSHWSTWAEICSGFFKFGTVPIQRTSADVAETVGELQPGKVANVFVSWFTTGRFPQVDFSLIALIAALAAIAGNGGLTNTPISNFTRDQGWGMGYHVGAIPSIVGGHGISLSHVGSVFQVTRESFGRWRGWYRHVMRDQLCVWVPACFVGVALPSMLSVEFLPRGTVADNWTAAALTAEGVGKHVADPPSDVLASLTGLSHVLSGPNWGNVFWALTLFCGFLVLGVSMVSTIDGMIRRWVDVFWTASARLRELDPSFIKHVYFRVLVVYGILGSLMLWLNQPTMLIKIATLGYNFALGFSCWHVIAVNSILLPKELRPNLFVRTALLLGGLFFTLLGVAATTQTLTELGWLKN